MPTSLNHISPEKNGGSVGGGGPEDAPGFPQLKARLHGFLTLAFGFALGIALIVLFALIAWLKPGVSLPTFSSDALTNFVFVFLFGLVGGTLLAGIYNLLVLRRLNLFGIESNLD